MEYRGQDRSIHDRVDNRLGVLLCNLGTPDAPTAPALRRYLREFLSDPRVIELPRWKWWPILHGIILRVRPARSAKLYQSVWGENGSPLLDISSQQVNALQNYLDQAGVNARVRLGMRYGQPAIGEALEAFQDEGIQRIVILPLYPQYAGATSGSTFDAVADALKGWRWVPQLHFVNTYHDNPSYISALAASIREHIVTHGKPDKLLLSYHGMPERYFKNGDPYYCFCQKTTRLVAEQLGLAGEDYLTTFQSRFGREPWLQPYTDKTLEQLAAEGTKHVAVVCPGFSADCLETLEEIAGENKTIFTEAGGETFHYIPALNVRDDHIAMMAELVGTFNV